VEAAEADQEDEEGQGGLGVQAAVLAKLTSETPKAARNDAATMSAPSVFRVMG
jgi:hypothetical protein